MALAGPLLWACITPGGYRVRPRPFTFSVPSIVGRDTCWMSVMMMMIISYILSNIVYATVSSELLLDTKHYSMPFTRSTRVLTATCDVGPLIIVISQLKKRQPRKFSNLPKLTHLDYPEWSEAFFRNNNKVLLLTPIEVNVCKGAPAHHFLFMP